MTENEDDHNAARDEFPLTERQKQNLAQLFPIPSGLAYFRPLNFPILGQYAEELA